MDSNRCTRAMRKESESHVPVLCCCNEIKLAKKELHVQDVAALTINAAPTEEPQVLVALTNLLLRLPEEIMATLRKFATPLAMFVVYRQIYND